MNNEYVHIRLKRPEGYEDVHPELVLEDAHINPAFEPEVVATPADAARLALERIANPLAWEQANVPECHDLDMPVVLRMIDGPDYYQRVARAALSQLPPTSPSDDATGDAT